MRPQDLILFGRKLEHEIYRKPLSVALHLLIQLSDRDAIEFSQIAIEDDPLVAEDQDSRFNRSG